MVAGSFSSHQKKVVISNNLGFLDRYVMGYWDICFNLCKQSFIASFFSWLVFFTQIHQPMASIILFPIVMRVGIVVVDHSGRPK